MTRVICFLKSVIRTAESGIPTCDIEESQDKPKEVGRRGSMTFHANCRTTMFLTELPPLDREARPSLRRPTASLANKANIECSYLSDMRKILKQEDTYRPGLGSFAKRTSSIYQTGRKNIPAYRTEPYE